MKRIALVALATSALVGCGGTAKIGGGKEGAAQAFFAASSASSAGANKSAQPLDVAGSVSWKCPEGGEASLQGFSVNVTGGTGANVQQTFTINYNNCGAAKSDEGVAIFNGSMTVSQAVVTTNGAVSVDQTFKGHIDVRGAFNDFIEADVKQQVAVSGLSSTGGAAVTMKLVGTITTSSESFTYNEDVNVTAGGKIAVAVTKM